MLAPPVAQGAGGRPVGGAGAGPGGLGTRGQQSVGPPAALWPLTPNQPSASPVGQSQSTPPLSTTPAPAHSQGVSRYGFYSLFPGSNPGGYVAAAPATPGGQSTRAYHSTTHKVSESVFSAAVGVGVGVGGYTWGAPTPPPGSPYSPVPVPVTQLELLAKNLANLAPPAQQALSLQGVGVNVGSLHHAQHTQHTQHTLNLAGLHNLHHGGLHQSTFSPQLSLVTGSAPTLTINSFSSPNSNGNVVPTSGVLLQEYQSPISSNTSCQSSSLCSSSGPSTVATTSTSAMVIQGTTYQGITKRREAFLPSQGQPIKLENKSRQTCVCRSTNGKTKIVHSEVGCSRTLPIVSSWNGQDVTSAHCNGTNTINSGTTMVKREPLTSVPCQVAEVSTSLHATTTAVKIEPLPPKSENGIVVSNSGCGIPVGIAVARQRLQHQETSSSTRNVSLSHHTSHHASYHHFQPDAMGGTSAMTVGGATLLHCGGSGEDRPSHLTIPSTTLPPGLNAALNSTLNSTLGGLGNAATTAWPHTFWQYPTTAMPVDPMGFSQMGIGGLQGGLQLVRDPTTGDLLLIHAAAEQVQQAVVWPNYPSNSGGSVGPPPLLLPPPPPPSLQLLSDIGGARIVLTDNKRKQQNNLPIVKIEADCSNSPTTIITSTESTKAMQTVTSMSASLIPDSPLVTTLHYYPHAPALLQISQAEPTHCRSQATSPVSCLTPPPESTTVHPIETREITPIVVQDASNQTDSPEVEDEATEAPPIVKQEQNLSPCQMQNGTNLTNFDIVSSPEKLCNIVRIPNLNSNSVCSAVPNKPEKLDPVASDAPRYSPPSPEPRSITSVDRTIEHVVNCHAHEERIPEVRSGPKIIEITEENCDSFHENLEFFSRRRDVDTERKERAVRVPESLAEVETKVEVETKTVEPIINGSKKIGIKVTANCISCKTLGPDNFRKSFDMPSIDYEEQACEQVVVKQEKEDKFTDCIYAQKNQSRSVEPTKRHSVEKFHPGIENVVEKLKKNAAAAMQDIRKTEGEISQVSNTEDRIWKVEGIANPNADSDKCCNNNLKLEAGKVVAKRIEKNSYNSPKKNYVNNYMLNNNEEKITLAQNKSHKTEDMIQKSEPPTEDKYVSKITGTKNCSLPDPKVPPIKEVSTNSKVVVDLSGLELLSNSIEQFEHLKPEGQSKLSEAETPTEFLKSPAKLKPCVTPQSESNNNNVDSPLGLLCALAEQRFMEEVVNDGSKESSSIDNSEEISQVGILLLNLGKANSHRESTRGEKRKYSEGDDHESAKRIRYRDEGPRSSLELCEKSPALENDKVAQQKEKTKRQIDFSERNGAGINPRKVNGSEDDQKERCLQSVTNLKVDNTRVHSEYKKKYEYHIRDCKQYFDENYHRAENDFTDSEAENNVTESDLPGYRTSADNGNFRIEDCQNSHHRYRSQQSEDEAKKFIARKGQSDGDTDGPNMDAMELGMRVQLADIQRKYRETQKELSKLTPKKEDRKAPGRPRKKSHSSSSESGGAFPSPPILEPMMEFGEKSPIRSPDVVPPPLTSGVVGMPRCNVNLVKLGEPRSHIKLLDSIPSIPIPVPPVASPITVLPTSKLMQDDEEKSLTRLEYDTSSPAPTVTSLSSASKKRKVGRPRKLMCASGSIRHLTETIVAKKPKSKGSLVGYLLAAKNRHLQNKFVNKTGYTPLPFKSGIPGSKVSPKTHKNSKHLTKAKAKPAKQTPLHNKSVISSIIAEKEKFSTNVKLEKQANKVKPKLKAEAKLKTWEDDDNGDWDNVAENIPPVETLTPAELEPKIKEGKIVPEKENEKHEKSKKKKRKSCSSSPKRRKSSADRDSKDSKRRKSTECKECKECARVAKNEKADKTDNVLNRCKLTAAHLAIDQLRVLTAMGGLFYAGRLSAVQAPDVYAITLDGERGNRPHIHPREEILRDAIVEVCPSSTVEIPPGTRLCAYWSQQYRCLYPGTSVEPSEPDPELDEKFISVEFDDGDSGRIALDDIRLLQPDYPVVEYDPNPLLTLGKRRRQTSLSTEEKRSSTGSQPPMNGNSDAKSSESSKTDNGESKVSEDHRERKRLKKRRRDKLKRLQDPQDGKKRHKKHKCCEEHRKHKHRKHRKHRHRHSHHSSHSSHSEASHHSGGESCSGQKSEEDSPAPSEKTDPEVEVDDKLVEEVKQEPESIAIDEDEDLADEKQEKSKKSDKKAKSRDKQEVAESRSKMAAFLPARQLWGWAGKGYRRPGAKGRAKKQFFKAIQRGSETIEIGDSAVFLSTGRPDRPYIGRIKSMWETTSSNMIVKVKWFYHPEETIGCPTNLKYPGALFESPHTDENDVQTISHKCEVLPLDQYVEKLSKEPHRFLTIYDNNDIYYLAGYYDPTTYLLNMQPGVV